MQIQENKKKIIHLKVGKCVLQKREDLSDMM